MKLRFNQICLAVIAASFFTIAMASTGVIKPAHAVSVNVAVKMLEKIILGSEARLTEEIKKTCADDD